MQDAREQRERLSAVSSTSSTSSSTASLSSRTESDIKKFIERNGGAMGGVQNLMRAYDLRQFLARPMPYTHGGLAAAAAAAAASITASRMLSPQMPVFAPPILPLAATSSVASMARMQPSGGVQPFDYRRECLSPSSQVGCGPRPFVCYYGLID